MAVRRILEILSQWETTPVRSSRGLTWRSISELQDRSVSGTCTELARMMRQRLITHLTIYHRRNRRYVLTDRGRNRLAWYQRKGSGSAPD